MTIYGPEIKQIPLPNPKQFDADNRAGILDSYGKLRMNPIEDIFSELGSDSLNGAITPHQDRYEFDLRVMKGMGYGKKELDAIYGSLVHLVRQRKSKAQSF